MSQTQFMSTSSGMLPLITDDSFSQSFFSPNRNFILLESPDFLEPLESPGFLEPSDTGIRDDSSKKSESIILSPEPDGRFRDILKKIESLPLSKAIKYNAEHTIWLLIRDIDKNGLLWHEPFVQYDHSEYMCVEWCRGNKSLYLNIDADEQWWSKILEEGSKTKTDMADIDYSNLSKHWEWLIND